LAVILVAALPVGCRRPLAPSVSVERGERLLVIAPHPDDETLGAGGLIQRVLSAHGTVRVVLVTAGDGYVEAVRYETGELRPRAPVYVAYGERRLREARAAVRKLGGDGVRVGLLGFPDGGLEQPLQAHWWRDVPERSPTTGALRPPYPEALDRTVAYDGDDLRRELLRVLHETGRPPSRFPIRSTASRSQRHGRLRAARAGGPARPGRTCPASPRVPRALARLAAGMGRSPAGAGGEGATPGVPAGPPDRGLTRVALPLSRTEIDGKAAALECYVTQQEVMSSLLAAFVRRTEPFTVFTVAEVRGVGSTIQRKARR